MRFLVTLVLLVLALASPATLNAQEPGCEQFDSLIWAQTVFLETGDQSLDPDSDGIACEDVIADTGFAPATWTNEIPDNVTPAQLVRVIDGDTLDVTVNGQAETVRIFRADTPEQYEEPQCGGDVATTFTNWAMSFNDATPTIYLEDDVTARDRYDRRLAYVWFEIDGQPYMLNELLIRAGIAADVDYGDHLHDRELKKAAAFAEDYELGMWNLCGGFGVPLAASSGGDALASTGSVGASVAEPEPKQSAAQGVSECDPSYPSVCIPPLSQVGDLNCPEVGNTWIETLPPDPHGLDRDHDGWGCEG